MSKLLAACAAAALTALIVLPAPAGAAQQRIASAERSGPIEVSASRRQMRRHVRHYRTRLTVRRWCGPQGRYCDAYDYGTRFNAPFAPYAFALYYRNRPYWSPAPHVGFGPFGTAPYGLGSSRLY
jgi:hypothetical protein